MVTWFSREDASPLMTSCRCYCCENHSRAYVHHLLREHEILGGVLLQTHNLTWMFEFFKEVRYYIETALLHELNYTIMK